MNFKTHAPARREGTTLQPNVRISPIPSLNSFLVEKTIYQRQHVETRRSFTQRRGENLLPDTITGTKHSQLSTHVSAVGLRPRQKSRRGAYADLCGATLVVERGLQAVARGAARFI
jgi:hypothetical protein